MTGQFEKEPGPLQPVFTEQLLVPLHEELITFLESLDATQWAAATVAGTWKVRDVVAHLMDGDLRRIAATRDGHVLSEGRATASYKDVVDLVNDLNAGGVSWARRLSTRLLRELVSITGRWSAELLASLPPHGDAAFPVAWAGESRSANWMDVGREYTERWHHQMQIRDAVGAPLLLDAPWFPPLLDISVRAFPYALRLTDAPSGTSIVFEVTSENGGTWCVVREAEEWRVYAGSDARASARLIASPDAAWRLLFNALPAHRAADEITVQGDRALVQAMLRARSVMV